MHCAIPFALLSILLSPLTPVAAQQTNQTAPVVGVGDSFHEFIGTQWGLSGRGWFFNFGGGLPGGAAPPFGGFDGSSGLNGGFGFGGGGVSGGFRFMATQGSSRSLGSTSGSLTQLVGAPGYIFNGTLTPFVTEITPVVGNGAPAMVPISPLRQRLNQLGGVQGLRPPLRLPEPAAIAEREKDEEGFVLGRREAIRAATPGGLASGGSSAERGDESIAEIRRRQAVDDAEREAELDRLLAQADRLEAAGDLRGAANIYSRAAAKVEGARREEFVLKARQLRGK